MPVRPISPRHVEHRRLVPRPAHRSRAGRHACLHPSLPSDRQPWPATRSGRALWRVHPRARRDLLLRVLSAARIHCALGVLQSHAPGADAAESHGVQFAAAPWRDPVARALGRGSGRRNSDGGEATEDLLLDGGKADSCFAKDDNCPGVCHGSDFFTCAKRLDSHRLFRGSVGRTDTRSERAVQDAPGSSEKVRN
jgi:hypothetical protein